MTGSEHDEIGHRDVFICHASSDKDAAARPLADELSRRGIRCWLDEAELKLGDSLWRGIDRGLRSSRYLAIVLSPSLFERWWPIHEIGAAFALESHSKETRILPILHELTYDDIVERSPLLAGRLSASTRDGIAQLADQIAEVVRAGRDTVGPPAHQWVTTDAGMDGYSQIVGSAIDNTAHLIPDAGIREQLAHALGELALNAFRHGGASFVRLAIGNASLTMADDGAAFTPIDNAATDAGVGLHVLKRFLELEHGALVSHSRGPDDRNYLVMRFPAKATGSRRCEVYVTGEGFRSASRDGWMPLTEVDFPHGCREYVYDATDGDVATSFVADITGALLEALPTGAILHVLVSQAWKREILAAHWANESRVKITLVS